MATFDPVADEYDTARPPYPAEVFDALGRLDGLTVLDVGAGTGIGTRPLIARGAEVIAVDTSRAMLRRASAHTPGLVAIVADGAALPIRPHTVDLLCFAQSWHWLDSDRRVAEVHRVLRAGGRWAGWWSHGRADGEPWFDSYWDAIERCCAGTHRGQRDTDWSQSVAVPGMFDVADRITVPWIRDVAVNDWMTDQESHSYVVGLGARSRAELLDELRSLLDDEFPDGRMSVRYETWLWIGTRV